MTLRHYRTRDPRCKRSAGEDLEKFRHVIGDEREVALAGVKARPAFCERRGDMTAHRRGHRRVLFAVPQVNFFGDVFETEGPRRRVETPLPGGAARAEAHGFERAR